MDVLDPVDVLDPLDVRSTVVLERAEFEEFEEFDPGREDEVLPDRVRAGTANATTATMAATRPDHPLGDGRRDRRDLWPFAEGGLRFTTKW